MEDGGGDGVKIFRDDKSMLVGPRMLVYEIHIPMSDLISANVSPVEIDGKTVQGGLLGLYHLAVDLDSHSRAVKMMERWRDSQPKPPTREDLLAEMIAEVEKRSASREAARDADFQVIEELPAPEAGE